MPTLRSFVPQSLHPMARTLKRLFAGVPPIDPPAKTDNVTDIDYHREYARTDLTQNYWLIVGPSTKAEYDRLAKLKLQHLIDLGLRPDSRLLDVGCGTGQVAQTCAEYLSDKGFYFGTDVGAEGIEFCKQRFPRPNFRFAVNEATTLPIHGETFDAACYFSVFTHTYLDETALLLAETERLLAPWGWVFADLFTSPTVEGSEGNRGAMVVNRDRFLRLAKLVGFPRAEVVMSQQLPEGKLREFFKLSR
ncbi:class I SAM-dependent methyltransferase [Limnoglobus roseus]|uniref:Class I SAM-dependent methyltransferase n=1 Tax=Limnoglobus roseus TaxID=2598579 RepID=A0A5C1A910_9BACT|nr:class I SAM-dependent methyltransferase [Limnoglobus roseus]QEL15849.1 class I SAM-dependent methyltransferase [Limnoglobus roseus]